MLGIHVLFGFTREPIHVGPSPKKNKSSASRYEIPKTDPNFFAPTRFTSSKFTSGFRFFHFLRRESGGRVCDRYGHVTMKMGRLLTNWASGGIWDLGSGIWDPMIPIREILVV